MPEWKSIAAHTKHPAAVPTSASRTAQKNQTRHLALHALNGENGQEYCGSGSGTSSNDKLRLALAHGGEDKSRRATFVQCSRTTKIELSGRA